MNEKSEKKVWAHLQNKRQLITLTRTLFLFLFRATFNQCEFNKSNRVYVLAEILICWSVYPNEVTIFMNVRIFFINATMIQYSIYCCYESGISLIFWICTTEILRLSNKNYCYNIKWDSDTFQRILKAITYYMVNDRRS